MHGVWPWVIGVVAVGVAIGLFLWWRRRRYLEDLRAHGWSHVSAPTLADVADLQAPPFGLGLSRSVDELVSGTTAAGFGFRVFEWAYDGQGPRFSDRVACLRLPFALPDAFLGEPGRARSGIGCGGRALAVVEADGLAVIAPDGSLARELAGAVAPAALGFRQATGVGDLGIDGNQLVAVGAPKDPDVLAGFLASLDSVALAIAGGAGLPARQVAPRGASWFYGHPEWEYVGSDDSVLDLYPVTTEGFGHRTEDLVRGVRDGVRVDAFRHHWKTQHTETYTDGEGHTHTRTVVDNHSEPVCAFALPFSLPTLSVNGRWVGHKVSFESSDFNQAFTVRTDDPRFASDVIHPRTMEWLLAVRPRGWTLSGQVVMFEVEDHDLLVVDACGEVLRGWLGRIPRFVWADRQLQPPAYLVE